MKYATERKVVVQKFISVKMKLLEVKFLKRPRSNGLTLT